LSLQSQDKSLRKKRKTRRRSSPAKSFRINDPVAPAENSDAGDDRELHDARLRSNIRGYRRSSEQHLEQAKKLLKVDRKRADREARLSLDSAARAFWWAEDTDAEEEQHQLMHRAGRWTRRNLGCHLEFDGVEYQQTCPIAIAHKRIGVSPGFVAQLRCSICGADLSDCEHVVGRAYWVRGGPRDGQPCRVCFDDSCRRHKADRLYRAPVIKVISDVEFHELSWVSRPADPEARLLALPVDSKRLTTKLGPGFVMGMTVNCDKCLGECWGFDELNAD
jgi:hypothetical protein